MNIILRVALAVMLGGCACSPPNIGDSTASEVACAAAGVGIVALETASSIVPFLLWR